jgi:hypothetical protein
MSWNEESLEMRQKIVISEEKSFYLYLMDFLANCVGEDRCSAAFFLDWLFNYTEIFLFVIPKVGRNVRTIFHKLLKYFHVTKKIIECCSTDYIKRKSTKNILHFVCLKDTFSVGIKCFFFKLM